MVVEDLLVMLFFVDYWFVLLCSVIFVDVVGEIFVVFVDGNVF